MAETTPMSQLRKMRDLRRRICGLTDGRDDLIREALEGHSEREVAIAIGLDHSRIHQIKVEGAEG